MKLNDLIVPTEIGTGKNTVLDLFSLPNRKKLIENYHLNTQDFTVNAKNNMGQKYWVLGEGYIDSRTGVHYPIRYNQKNPKPYSLQGRAARNAETLYFQNFGVRPCVRFDVDAYLALTKTLEARNDKSHSPYLAKKGQHKYMCLNFGEYPDRSLTISTFDKCPEKMNKTYYNTVNGTLFDGRREIGRNYEYMIDGARYISTYQWGNNFAPIVPIQWRILNWQDLPQTINPNGTGTATTIDLFACKILNELPYQITTPGLNQTTPDQKKDWYASFIRDFLNGYQDFHKHNFITEAFENEMEILKSINFEKHKKATLILNQDTQVLKNKVTNEITK